MEVSEVKVILYQKQNHIQICVNQQLVSEREVIYFHKSEVTENFCSVWFDDTDLLALCSVYEIISVIAEPGKIIISVSDDLDWEEFTENLLFLIHNTSPGASVDIVDDCELFVANTAIRYDHYHVRSSVYELAS